MSYCKKHDTVIECELCQGVFHGSYIELARKISDHQLRGKLVKNTLKLDLIEYGSRPPIYTLSKEWFGGRQKVARWVEIEPKHWVREEIPQVWDWID